MPKGEKDIDEAQRKDRNASYQQILQSVNLAAVNPALNDGADLTDWID